MNNTEVRIQLLADYSELKQVAALRRQFWPEDGDFALDEQDSLQPKIIKNCYNRNTL
jgi:hypothetical protein